MMNDYMLVPMIVEFAGIWALFGLVYLTVELIYAIKKEGECSNE